MRAPAGLLLLLGLLGLRAARRPPHSAPSRGAPQLTAEMLELRECDASSSVLVANWTQRQTASGAILIDALFLVTRPTPTFSKALVTLTKCSEYETHCETVLSLPMGREACTMWGAKYMFWTPVMERMIAVDPPHRSLGCPLRKGGYAMRDAQFDFSHATHMIPYQLENRVWTIRVQNWDADTRPHGCLFAKGKIKRWTPRPDSAARP